MGDGRKGKLTLKKVPVGVGRDQVVDYLLRVSKEGTRPDIEALVRRAPVVLSPSMDGERALQFVMDLEKLGAVAEYEPEEAAVTEGGERSSATGEESAGDLQEALLGAFRGKLPGRAVHVAYTAGLFLVSVAMVILPLIYVALIGFVGYLLFWHATHNHVIFQELSSIRLAAFFYGGPLLVGILLLIFLMKPLFVRMAWEPRPRRLFRTGEPLLFSFVERVCRAVGAPTPSEIHVDLDVNASASFRGGFSSFFRNDLVLTIGLPLVGGLDLPQFTGVLAHEFGHFAQPVGMRMSYLIRSINGWFHRVVYEEDEWDENIRRWTEDAGGGLVLILWIARLSIWLSRRFLWVLMMLGHGISCFLIRQMEYDADRYATRLVGSKSVVSLQERLLIVSTAHGAAFHNLWRFWEDGRLVDSFPEFVALMERNISDQVRRRLVHEELVQRKTGLFDTHPAPRDRVARARRVQESPLFEMTGGREGDRGILPASVLFQDFDVLSRSLSMEFYQERIDHRVSRENMVSVGEMARRQGEEEACHEALVRMFMGNFRADRPLGLGTVNFDESVDVEKNKQEMSAVDSDLNRRISTYAVGLEQFDELRKRLSNVVQARVAQSEGYPVDAAHFGLPSSDPRTIESLRKQVEEQLEATRIDLEAVERLFMRKLFAGLRMARAEGRATAQAGGANLPNLLEAASLLEKSIVNQEALLLDAHCLYMFYSLEEGEPGNSLSAATRAWERKVRERLRPVMSALSGAPYPFDHPRPGYTLTNHVFEQCPGEENPGELLQKVSHVVGVTRDLYARTVAHLALMVR